MEMHIKAIMRYYLIPVRMVIIRQEITNVGKEVMKKEHFCTVGGNVKWCSHYGEHF